MAMPVAFTLHTSHLALHTSHFTPGAAPCWPCRLPSSPSSGQPPSRGAARPARTCACVCTCMHTCTYMCMYAYLYVHVHVCIHVHVHVCTCARIYMYVCMHTRMHMHACVYLRVRACARMCTHTRTMSCSPAPTAWWTGAGGYRVQGTRYHVLQPRTNGLVDRRTAVGIAGVHIGAMLDQQPNHLHSLRTRLCMCECTCGVHGHVCI